LRLIRVVGPQTAHKYHPDSKIEIAGMLEAIAGRGREPYARKVKFTTWTLAYNRMKWVTIDALARHWERARVNAEIAGESALNVETGSVTAFSLDMASGGCPLDLARQPVVTIDGQKVTAPALMSDRSWHAHFQKTANRWTIVDGLQSAGLRKRHALQGPV